MKSNWGASLIPSGAFGQFHSEVDALFNQFFGSTKLPSLFKSSGYPVDHLVKRDENGKPTNYILEIALAGVPKENISVKTVKDKGSYLEISVKKREKKEGVHYQSTSNKDWKVSYALVDEFDAAGIETKLENGMLTIDIPYSYPAVEETEVPIK